MFGIFGKRSSGPLALESKLEILAECGLSLAPPFVVADLLQSWTREEFEKRGFTLTLVALGMTEEQPPWRLHCANVAHFDAECIEDTGDYVRIAERMAALTQGSLVIENVRDQVEIEDGLANLDFEHSGRLVHFDFTVKDDWVDPSVFSRFVGLLALADPAKVYLYYNTGGQDFVVACVARDQVEALKRAGVEFSLLR